MNTKFKHLWAIVLLLILQACSQTSEYGKRPLNLEGFDFDLDLNTFFKDESLFDGSNEAGFSVYSEDVKVEENDIMPGYIRYATYSMSQSRPLAEYAGVQFEKLDLYSDWNDESVLMLAASSDYKSGDEIMKIIQELKSEFGAEPELQRGGFTNNNILYLVYEMEDKQIQFGMVLSDLDFIPWPETSSRRNNVWGDLAEPEPEPEKILLTTEIENNLEQLLKDSEENQCFLFITKPTMAELMSKQTGRSGTLVYYWQRDNN